MLKVLTITKDEEIQKDVLAMLSRHGSRVTTTSNGQEGLGLLQKSTFDLVIADMLIGAGNGVEVVKEIAVGFPHLPIIAVSGSSLARSGPYQELVTHLGVNGFLHYPFGAETLRKEVDHVMEGGCGAPAHPLLRVTPEWAA